MEYVTAAFIMVVIIHDERASNGSSLNVKII